MIFSQYVGPTPPATPVEPTRRTEPGTEPATETTTETSGKPTTVCFNHFFPLASKGIDPLLSPRMHAVTSVTFFVVNNSSTFIEDAVTFTFKL